jgi:hypothetical protein
MWKEFHFRKKDFKVLNILNGSRRMLLDAFRLVISVLAFREAPVIPERIGVIDVCEIHRVKSVNSHFDNVADVVRQRISLSLTGIPTLASLKMVQ